MLVCTYTEIDIYLMNIMTDTCRYIVFIHIHILVNTYEYYTHIHTYIYTCIPISNCSENITSSVMFRCIYMYV